jgi:hypothetical protein
MNSTNIRTLAIATVAAVCVAMPAMSSAQRYGQGRWPVDQRQYRYNDRYDLRDLADRTERQSNDFRAYFEHNFRDNGHGKRYDRYGNDRDQHGDHEGRNGRMSLKDAIQNLDEALERLRSEITHNGRSRKAQEIMDDVREHSNDVEQRISRVTDWYDYTGRDWRSGNGNWRYDRSDLSSRWRDLRGDINDLQRSFGGRGRD